MKRILTIAAFAVAATGAWAQAQAPAQKPGGEKPAAEAPPQLQADAPKVTVTRKPNPRRFEDARHCLEKGTNTEIIKCAEVYL